MLATHTANLCAEKTIIERFLKDYHFVRKKGFLLSLKIEKDIAQLSEYNGILLSLITKIRTEKKTVSRLHFLI